MTWKREDNLFVLKIYKYLLSLNKLAKKQQKQREY